MRPADVSRNQWEHVVGWTINGLGNCCCHHGFVDRRGFSDFVDELDRRIDEGTVGMETIDWIWDEYERTSKYGPSYSERYRPTTPERLEQPFPSSWGLNIP